MSTADTATMPNVDPEELARSLSDIADQSQRVIADFLERNYEPSDMEAMDMSSISKAFMELGQRMAEHPETLVEAQVNLWRGYLDLWTNATLRILGEDAAGGSVAAPDDKDKRFKAAEWQDVEVFDFIKQSYLLTARCIEKVVDSVGGMSEADAQKVRFYTKQFVDAMSPSNFAMTNPEVIRATVETGGENLLKGLKNLLSDLEKGRISMTDESAFELGRNVATSEGKVVFRNRMLELIHYAPQTDEVYERPVVIAPPWINKFYILDLQPKNSLIRWLCSKGYSTYVISWVNPDEEMAEVTFDDYLTEGLLEAVRVAREDSGVDQVNVAGYCIGGTLTSSALAYLAARKETPIHSATLLTTLTDFSQAGELRVFTDEDQLSSLDRRMKKHGYLPGADLSVGFNMLRSNDLIWSFAVNNYLLGKEPFPFDLLYWNSDPTRLPRAMHLFYIKQMYIENNLVKPGSISLAGQPIDLSKVKLPVYMISTREDHIAPWKATYAATQLFSGKTRFVLGGSGHIAGVVNPPEKKKYGYCTNTALPADPDQWLAKATEHKGSWWTDWDKWLAPKSGEKVPARQPGTGAFKALEDAPGSYVKVRA